MQRMCTSELVWCKLKFCLRLTVQASGVSNVFVHDCGHCLKASYTNFLQLCLYSIQWINHRTCSASKYESKYSRYENTWLVLCISEDISVKAWLTREASVATIKYRKWLFHVQSVSEDCSEGWTRSSFKTNCPLYSTKNINRKKDIFC